MTKENILLCVNSDIGRGNTIGFRFTKIADELEKQQKTYHIIARANYDSHRHVVTPWYKNYFARLLNAIHIYIFPRFQFRHVDMWLFDRFVLSHLKRQKITYRVAHIGEYIPKSIAFLKKTGTTVFLDVPIGHVAYAAELRKRGIIVGKEEMVELPGMKDTILSVDRLIVPSAFVEETVRLAGYTTPADIIPFGADVRPEVGEEDIRKKFEEKKPFTFLFAGNVNLRKGIPYLLDAWKKAALPDAELLICGRVYKEITDLYDIRHIPGVKFLGFVNLKEYFLGSHVFVFPTLLEGSAKAVYEAMSYGLPVITTLNAGSIVRSGVSGYSIPIADSDMLAVEMQRLYFDRYKAAMMGVAAWKEVQAYTWDAYAEKVVGTYISV